jgi:hypothetical protein
MEWRLSYPERRRARRVARPSIARNRPTPGLRLQDWTQRRYFVCSARGFRVDVSMEREEHTLR